MEFGSNNIEQNRENKVRSSASRQEKVDLLSPLSNLSRDSKEFSQFQSYDAGLKASLVAGD